MLCNVAHKAAVGEYSANICLNWEGGDGAGTDQSVSIMWFSKVELLPGSQQNAKVPMQVLLFDFF